MGIVKHASREVNARRRTALPPAGSNRPLSPTVDRRPVKDCLDCTISRMQHRRLCREHWEEFMRWLTRNFRTVEYRHDSPTERDRMVRKWVETEADNESAHSTAGADVGPATMTVQSS